MMAAPRTEPVAARVGINSASNPNALSMTRLMDVEDYKHIVTSQVQHGSGEIKIASEKSIYQALEDRGLLVKPSAPTGFGTILISDGEVGLADFNGKPRFLAPGRHTLWSCMKTHKRTVNIVDKVIQFMNVTIVTVEQGEIGLSLLNGQTILLDPGRFILVAPHKFERTTPANARYIELGTYHRITVPAGFVALAYDRGQQIVIRPEDTSSGPFETTSPTFLFDAKTGFQSTQLQVRELDELTVNTRDGISITCKGLITYRIHDPRAAFVAVSDVHGAVKRGAEAMLTSLFLNAGIDEIAPSLPTHPREEKAAAEAASSPDGVPPHQRLQALEPYGPERADFSRHIRECFLHDFSRQVHEMGIELKNLNIEKLEFDQRVQDLLRKRAQARLETATNLSNMFAQTEVAMQEADRQRRQKQTLAEADANALRTRVEAEATAVRVRADAELYAAEQRSKAAQALAAVPLAAQLELRRVDVEIVRAAGDRTTFLPLGMQVGAVTQKTADDKGLFMLTGQADGVVRGPAAK